MPVFIDKSGLAVDLPAEQAQAAAASGEYFLPLIGPDGTPTSATLQEAGKLLQQGYTQPASEQLKSMLDYAKYSTPTEQAKTFAEGAAEAATFGLSTLAETKLLGVDPAAIRKREEINPGLKTAGEVTGLLGSLALPGAGAVGAAARTATAATRGIGNTVGRKAAEAAIEGALFQLGDEASKVFAKDPNQTLESAALNVGLAGLIGGGVVGGAVAGKQAIIDPLWKATKGSELSKFLGVLRDKAQTGSASSSLDDLVQKSGLDIPPEVRATMSGSDLLEEAGQSLAEASNRSGREFRAGLSKFYKDVSDNVVTAMGKTADDVARVAEISEFEQGQAIQKAFIEELAPKAKVLSERYDAISKAYKGIEVPKTQIDNIAERIGKIAIEDGHALRSDSAAASALRSITKDLPNIKTLEDIRKFGSTVREDLTSKQLFNLNRKIQTALREVEDQAEKDVLSRVAPQLLGEHAVVRAEYKAFMDLAESLDDRLRVGRYQGPDSFMRAIKELTPEEIVRRTRGASDAELQTLLRTQFPKAFEQVRDANLSKLLKKVTNSARAVDGGIDSKLFFRELDKMSPEMRATLFNPEQEASLKAIKEILDRTPERMNPSGTARTLDAYFNAAGGAAGIAAALMTGSPVTGFITGYITKLLARDVPDAIKLAVLKSMGTTGPINPLGFKAAVELAEQSAKGLKRVSNVARLVASNEAVNIARPSKEVLKDLDKVVQTYSEDMTPAIAAHEDLSSFLPEHGMAAGTLTANAVNYLNSLRPKESKDAPMDRKPVPNPVEKARYERALSIAQDPMLIWLHIKNGTILPEDIQTISTIYPGLYSTFREKALEQVIDLEAANKRMPYQTMLGISMLLGMPLESSIMPQNVSANQVGGTQPPAPQQASGGLSEAKGKALNEIARRAMTPGQAREQVKGQNK